MGPKGESFGTNSESVAMTRLGSLKLTPIICNEYMHAHTELAD